jgi:hypothetical protein
MSSPTPHPDRECLPQRHVLLHSNPVHNHPSGVLEPSQVDHVLTITVMETLLVSLAERAML